MMNNQAMSQAKVQIQLHLLQQHRYILLSMSKSQYNNGEIVVYDEITNKNNFNVSVNSMQYSFTGVDASYTNFTNSQQPTIYLHVNDTLTLNVDVAGHPLNINTGNYTGTSYRVASNTTTNNGATSGTITFTPTSSGTYYYNCEYHSSMNGQIIVYDEITNKNTFSILTTTGVEVMHICLMVLILVLQNLIQTLH